MNLENGGPCWGRATGGQRGSLCPGLCRKLVVLCNPCILPHAAYHSFFFSSIDTPPGPSATTSSRPPMTEVVWKKSYLRKSCMGL